jgi:hypothetical protein
MEYRPRRRHTLDYGETPWDNLTKAQLRRECERMYSALKSAHDVMRQALCSNPHLRYWNEGGAGYRALHKAEVALEFADGGFDNFYRAYLRYAEDLLFPEVCEERGDWTPWRICGECGQMLSTANQHDPLGKACAEANPRAPHARRKCPGVFRALKFEDLTKQAGREFEERAHRSLTDPLTEEEQKEKETHHDEPADDPAAL